MRLIRKNDSITLSHNRKDVLKIDLNTNTLFVYEDNDLFDGEELPVNKGFIKEDKDDKFKLPDIKKEQAKKKRSSRL